MKLLIFMLCLAIPSSLWAENIPTPRQAIKFNIKADGRQWVSEPTKANASGFTTQLIPKGDSVKAWREVAIYQIVFTTTPQAGYVKQWEAGLTGSDAKARVRETANTDGSITVTYTSPAADETGVCRFITGEDGIYMLAYQIRPDLKTDAAFKLWTGIVDDAVLIPNPERPKPSLSFKNVRYIFRDGGENSSEFTPAGQEDLAHWTDMITINVYKDLGDETQLASVAENVLKNYKANGATILGTRSIPGTAAKPTEYFIAAAFGRPELIEAVFVRFRLVKGGGLVIVYSHRLYGNSVGDQMSAWLRDNGQSTENALLGSDHAPGAAAPAK
ncbi:MAG TPA: hypothetical protein VMI53_00565 [Opitutaceae bacterium]|nr:hypothetical protein [Opitutaceae bacterium]